MLRGVAVCCGDLALTACWWSVAGTFFFELIGLDVVCLPSSYCPFCYLFLLLCCARVLCEGVVGECCVPPACVCTAACCVTLF